MSSRATIRARQATRVDEEAWRLILDLASVHRGKVIATAAELDLSPPHLFMLRRLQPGEAMPMSELAAFLHCDASNVTGLVDRLEAKGLLERRTPPHDRRVKHVVLTEEGERLRAKVLRKLHAPPDAMKSLSAGDQLALRDILRRALGRAP